MAIQSSHPWPAIKVRYRTRRVILRTLFMSPVGALTYSFRVKLSRTFTQGVKSGSFWLWFLWLWVKYLLILENNIMTMTNFISWAFGLQKQVFNVFLDCTIAFWDLFNPFWHNWTQCVQLMLFFLKIIPFIIPLSDVWE